MLAQPFVAGEAFRPKQLGTPRRHRVEDLILLVTSRFVSHVETRRLDRGLLFQTEVLVQAFELIDVKDPIEDHQLQHEKDTKAQKVRARDQRGVRQVTPGVRVHFASSPERANLREGDPEKRHTPERDDLGAKVAPTSLTPRPVAIQVIRGQGRDQVSGERRPYDTLNDMKAVEDRDRRK